MNLDTNRRLRPIGPVSIALFSLLLFLPEAVPIGVDPIRSWSHPLFLAGAFLLFALSVFRPAGRGDRLPVLLSPGLPWVLLLLLAALLLFRSHDPEPVAEGILIGAAAYLLYRFARRAEGGGEGDPAVLIAFLLPAALATGIGLMVRPQGTAPAGEPFGGETAWLLVALFASLHASLSARTKAGTVLPALAAPVFAAGLLLDPTPLRAAILLLTVAGAGAAAIRNPAAPVSGGDSRRAVRRFLWGTGPVLIAASLVVLFVPAQRVVFTDNLSVEQLYHWERIAGIIGESPAGIGPGNLPDALAPRIVPPDRIEEPLAPWPIPQASDLLRLQAELGWLFLPILIGGLAPVWAIAFLTLSRTTGRRARLGAAALLAAVLAGTAALFLYEPLRHPAAVAILCLVLARVTGRAEGWISPAAGRREGEPLRSSHGRAARVAAGLAVIAALYLAGATWMAGRHYEEGVRRYRAGQLEPALRHSEAALRIRPGHLPAGLLRAETLFAGGNCDAAAIEIRALRDRRPGNALLALRLLDCYDRQDFVREGVRLSGELAEVWPDSAAILAESGRWLERADRDEEAEPRLVAALELDPLNWKAKLALGTVLEKQNREEEAAYLYRGAARDRPDDPEAFVRLGNLRYRSGRYERAAQAYAAALRSAGEDPDILVRTGIALYMTDRWCQSLALLERSIAAGLNGRRRAEIEPYVEELRGKCPAGTSQAPTAD